MSKVITTKKINIDQLGHEVAADLNIISEVDQSIIESSLDEATLQKFIDDHKADDKWVNPDPKAHLVS
jgi:hypothetical protein